MKKKLGAQTLVYPTPVLIVATYDADNTPNAMNVAWGGICSSVPPCIQISIREDRKTYQNILEKKAFTINIPSVSNMKEADYFGLASGKEENKFLKTGLTAQKADEVDAPYIEEFPMALICEVIQTSSVGSHIQIVGEIKNVIANEDILGEDGSIAIAKLKPLSFNPSTTTYDLISESVGQAFQEGMYYK